METGNRNFQPPRECDQYRAPISKITAKLNGFLVWVNEEARSAFYKEFHRHLSMKDDRNLLDKWWTELPIEKRNEYKAKAKDPAYNNPEYNQQMREAEKNRRTFRHDNAFREHEVRNKHRREIMRENQEKIEKRGASIFVPSTAKIFDPNTFFISDFDAYSAIQIDQIKTNYGSKIVAGCGYEDLLNETMTWIGMTPGFSIRDEKTPNIFVAPLEISVINFNLKEGPISFKTIQLDLEKNILFNLSQEQTNEFEESMVASASKYGLEKPKFTESEEMAMQYWRDLKDYFFNEKEVLNRILCEKKYFNQIKVVLRDLAKQVSLDDIYLFEDHIKKQIISIEDFCKGIKKAANIEIPNEEADKYFEGGFMACDARVFCCIHNKYDINDPLRHFCQRAKGELSIRGLRRFLAHYDLIDMKKCYTENEGDFRSWPEDIPYPLCPEDKFVKFDGTIHVNRLICKPYKLKQQVEDESDSYIFKPFTKYDDSARKDIGIKSVLPPDSQEDEDWDFPPPSFASKVFHQETDQVSCSGSIKKIVNPNISQPVRFSPPNERKQEENAHRHNSFNQQNERSRRHQLQFYQDEQRDYHGRNSGYREYNYSRDLNESHQSQSLMNDFREDYRQDRRNSRQHSNNYGRNAPPSYGYNQNYERNCRNNSSQNYYNRGCRHRELSPTDDLNDFRNLCGYSARGPEPQRNNERPRYDPRGYNESEYNDDRHAPLYDEYGMMMMPRPYGEEECQPHRFPIHGQYHNNDYYPPASFYSYPPHYPSGYDPKYLPNHQAMARMTLQDPRNPPTNLVVCNNEELRLLEAFRAGRRMDNGNL